MARRKPTKATLRAQNIVRAARQLLSKETDFLEGIRELVRLGYEPDGCEYASGFEFLGESQDLPHSQSGCPANVCPIMVGGR